MVYSSKMLLQEKYFGVKDRLPFPRESLDFTHMLVQHENKNKALRSLLFLFSFFNKQQETIEQVECQQHKFPKPQRAPFKWRMIKKENIW